MGNLPPTARAWLCYALGTDSIAWARKQATGGIGWRDGNGVELTDPRYSFRTGTFLSENIAACEDGSLADQIALAQALGLPSQGPVSGPPAAPRAKSRPR